MRFVIVGAGAVGGTIGARMFQAGLDVLLVARGEHARVLATQGLDFRAPDGRSQLQIPVANGIDAITLQDEDVLIFTTKTQDTLPLLESLALMRTPGGRPGTSLPVVCAQNGVENERLAARRYDHVYGICVMLPATRLQPGIVLAHGAPHSGMLDIGRWPHGVDDRAEGIASALRAAGFVAVAEPAIMRWKYAKLLRNLGNSWEALTGDVERTGLRALRDEAEVLLAAAGIDVATDEEFAGRRGHQVDLAPVEGNDGRGGGSSWQSLTTGAGSIEADYLNGEIALVARQLGRRAPRNALLQRLANAAAISGAKPGDITTQRLGELLAAASAQAPDG